MNRLMLCAGQTRREGWKTLDAKGSADFTAVIPPLPPEVQRVEWDEIEWVHGISSLHKWDAIQALKEIHGVLRDGGKVVLEQPDFNEAIKGGPEWVFGDSSHFNKWIMNRSGWTPHSLAETLQQIGFKSIQVLEAQYHVPSRDFRVEAYR